MDVGVLGEIARFKLPALRKATAVADRPRILLVSKEGFTPALQGPADGDDRVRLLQLSELVSGA